MKKKTKLPPVKSILKVAETEDFTMVESFKALRTNIMFSLPGDVGCRKLLFTSSLSGEGKTTTTVNLAVSLAETDTRVLLIDADMRRPTVHRYFDIKSRSRFGLSNLLTGANGIEECMFPSPELPNLFIIPSGVLPPNPSELLGSAAMKTLLEGLEKEFDYIIIDTPPVGLVSDALSLVSMVNGVAVVVAGNKSMMPDVQKAVTTLKFADANILGFVLNRVSTKSLGYSKKSYQYSYSSTPSSDTGARKLKAKNARSSHDADEDDDT